MIKNLDETSVRGSNFYIIILAYLTDIAQSLEFISRKSYKHVNNQHQKLKFNQFKDLKEIEDRLDLLYKEIIDIFNSRKFERISFVIAQKKELIGPYFRENWTLKLSEHDRKNQALKTPRFISIFYLKRKT